MSGFKPVVEKDVDAKVSTSTSTVFGANAGTSSTSVEEAKKSVQSDMPKGLHV